MQAVKGYLQGSVSLSTQVRGKPRKVPVWIVRYRLPSGKDSRKTLGKAWLKASRPPAGFITESQANAAAQRFLDERADSVPDDRKTFRRAVKDFLRYCERERGLRGSTLHCYRQIGERLCKRPWGSQTWAERPIDAFADDDILALRGELLDADLSHHTINHYRRIVRGAFGIKSSNSVALAWEFMRIKEESKGEIQFYTPAEVSLLKAHAANDRDRAIFTLAVEAGPRMSEIRGLRVRDCDFEAGKLRFERGYTDTGGFAGTKGHLVRSVPMTDNVRAALWAFCADRDGTELVFEHEAKPGAPICGMGLYRHFISAARSAELPILRFHDLRHSFGTRAIRKVNIYELQRLMGHSSITTTEIYLHYAPDPDLAGKLSGLWESDEPSDNVVSLHATA